MAKYSSLKDHRKVQSELKKNNTKLSQIINVADNLDEKEFNRKMRDKMNDQIKLIQKQIKERKKQIE